MAVGVRVAPGQLGLREAVAAVRRGGELDGPSNVTDRSEVAKHAAVAAGGREPVITARLSLALLDGAWAGLSEQAYADQAIWVFGDWVGAVTYSMREHADVLLYESARWHGHTEALHNGVQLRSTGVEPQVNGGERRWLLLALLP